MADYDDKPHIIADFTYDRCTIRWQNVAQKDRSKFRSTIESYAEVLDDSYALETELAGDDLELILRHRGESTSTERQRLKGDVFMIIGDTIWGGGPG